MAAVLRREGACAIAQTVAQLMRQAGLRARMARRYQANTNSPRDWPVPHHVLGRQFRSARPHAVWMAGSRTCPLMKTGCIWPAWGIWRPSKMAQPLSCTVLDRAAARHRPPAAMLHHSERGSQYAATAQARVARYGMTAIVSQNGTAGIMRASSQATP